MLDPESAMLQRLGACTCNGGSVPDRLRVYTQEHVCNILQELHDCTHTRKLDLYTPSRVVVSSSAAEIVHNYSLSARFGGMVHSAGKLVP